MCAYLVATVGNGPTNHALRTLNMALSSWGFHVVGQRGFKTGAWMTQDELTARYYIQHQANPLEVVCARLAGATIARFVT